VEETASMTDLIPSDLSASIADATGQLMPRSKPVYEHDARVLAKWMLDQGITPEAFTRSHAIAYLGYLKGKHQAATVKRMISVARNIFAETVERGQRTTNPFLRLKGIPKANNETPHTALKKQQAKALLDAIDQSTHLGKRDYAMISLLLRTGIRRSECSALNIGDLEMDQGHHVAVIRHGKGDKRRKAKIPVDVFRSIQAHIEDIQRENVALSEPLFVSFDRWDRPTTRRISDKLVERTVKAYGEKIGVPSLTPHGLRATFATLAKEGKATLMQIQYAMGHDDPRTTERYITRKDNLDHNAVDCIDLEE
jgi:site-specific recombinase XerD